MPQLCSINCSLPDSFEAIGDIAGVGVFSALTAAASLSLLLALFSLKTDLGQIRSKRKDPRRTDSDKGPKLTQKMIYAISVGLSDILMVTSLALEIPTVSVMSCTISAYHYNLVCDLVLVTTASIFSSLMAVRWNSASKGPSWLRFIFAYLVLGFAAALFVRKLRTPAFPTFKPKAGSEKKPGTGLVLPAMCFIRQPDPNSANWDDPQFTNDDFRKHFDTASLILLIAICLSSLPYLPLANIGDPKKPRIGPSSRPKTGKNKFQLLVRGICWLFSIFQLMIGTLRFKKLQNWMTASGWFNVQGETSLGTSYGQFIPLILLILPFLSAIEAHFNHKNEIKRDRERKKNEILSSINNHEYGSQPSGRHPSGATQNVHIALMA